MGLYNKWWRYSGVRDLTHIVQATIVGEVVAVIVSLSSPGSFSRPLYSRYGVDISVESLPYGVIAFDLILTLLLRRRRPSAGPHRLGASVAQTSWAATARRCSWSAPATPASSSCARCSRPARSPTSRSDWSTTTRARSNLHIHGVRVVGTTRQLPQLVEEHAAEEVIIAMPSISGKVIQDIVSMCKTGERERQDTARASTSSSRAR